MSLLSYKIQQSGESEHLGELRTECVPTRKLCSAERKGIIIPQTKLFVTSRDVSVAAPRIWNSLRPDVTSAESMPVLGRRLKRICLAWSTNIRHSTSPPTIRYYTLTNVRVINAVCLPFTYLVSTDSDPTIPRRA